MALTPEQLDDFVTLTLSEFKRREWTDISLEYQNYASQKMLTTKAVTERGGKDINFKVQVRNTGNARPSGLYAQDVTRVEDVMVSASVPYSKQVTSFSYDVDEDLFQSEPETIIEELQIREHDALNSMAQLQEELLWSAPTGPTDTVPMGIPFWIQRNVTVPDGAFNGGNPSGFTGAAGVDSNVVTRWRNWAGQYTSVSRDDLVRKVKRAMVMTMFSAPVPHPTLGFGNSKFDIFTTYRVVEPLERLAETRNDNLGADVARYMGQVTIGGVPMTWVAHLEQNDNTDPLYGVNWGVLRPFVKKGRNMFRNPPKHAPLQHTVRNVFYDHWMNYICYNRRLTWILSLS